MNLRHIVVATLVTICGLFTVTHDSNARPSGGTATAIFTLRPEQIAHDEIHLRGGEKTAILFEGDGDGDIDCVLFDPSGEAVSVDNDSTDTCLLQVFPSRPGTYSVVVKNNGRRTTLVNMRSN